MGTDQLIYLQFPEKDHFKKKYMVKGVIAGAFDIIHPGYIKMFKDEIGT